MGGKMGKTFAVSWVLDSGMALSWLLTVDDDGLRGLPCRFKICADLNKLSGLQNAFATFRRARRRSCR